MKSFMLLATILLVLLLHYVSEEGKIREGLIYTAQDKQVLTFVPLNRRSKPITAEKFLRVLHKEADAQRKQQRSNSLSGLYK